jgi:ElaB/YqjD/DUF883 family membrane-anchored ribosome-binding protein
MAKDKIRNMTHENVDKIMDKAESMKASTKAAMEDARDKAAEIKDNIDEYIRENPEKSVLIAAGIGLALGALIATVMRRKD